MGWEKESVFALEIIFLISFQVFFADLPAIQAKFQAARISQDAMNVPPEQLENMAQRLETIGPRAAQRRVKLKFLEHKVYVTFQYQIQFSVFMFHYVLTVRLVCSVV